MRFSSIFDARQVIIQTRSYSHGRAFVPSVVSSIGTVLNTRRDRVLTSVTPSSTTVFVRAVVVVETTTILAVLSVTIGICQPSGFRPSPPYRLYRYVGLLDDDVTTFANHLRFVPEELVAQAQPRVAR